MSYTIKFSNSGSETQASGAGPASAVFGSDGSTSVDGLTVTVPNADLSGVLTDETHAIWISGDGWFAISGKADSGLSTANVTISTAATGSLTSQTYAIGGERSLFFTSTHLSDMEATIPAGTTLEFEAGYTETSTAVDNVTRAFSPSAGDITNPITIRGADPNNRPLFTNNLSSFVTAFSLASAGLQVEDCDFHADRDAGASDSKSVVSIGASRMSMIRCKITCPRVFTNSALIEFSSSGNSAQVISCELEATSTNLGDGVRFGSRSGSVTNSTVTNCVNGVVCSGYLGDYSNYVAYCRISDCGTAIKNSSAFRRGAQFIGNLIDDCTTGIQTSDASSYLTAVIRNSFSNCGTAINYVPTDENVVATQNNFYSCTIDTVGVPSFRENGSTEIDPQVQDSGTLDFTITNQDVIDALGVAPGQGGGGGPTVIVVEDD